MPKKCQNKAGALGHASWKQACWDFLHRSFIIVAPILGKYSEFFRVLLFLLLVHIFKMNSDVKIHPVFLNQILQSCNSLSFFLEYFICEKSLIFMSWNIMFIRCIVKSQNMIDFKQSLSFVPVGPCMLRASTP